MTPGVEPPAGLRQGLHTPAARSRSGLVRAGLVWWTATAVASIAVGSQALPWLDMLRYMPYSGVSSDVAVLHERWFERLLTGESASWIRAALLHLVLWRTLSCVPVVWVIAELRTPVGHRTKSRARLWTRVPHFVALSAALQLITTLAALFAIQHVATAVRDLSMGGVARAWLHALIAVALASVALSTLAVTDLARLALIHGRRSASRSRTAPLLDALELLWRRPVRSLCWTLSYALGAIVAGALGLGVASWATTRAPEGWGVVVSWCLAELGVVVSLVWRVYTWQQLLDSFLGRPTVAEAPGLFTTYAPPPSAIARNGEPPAPSPNPASSRDAGGG